MRLRALALTVCVFAVAAVAAPLNGYLKFDRDVPDAIPKVFAAPLLVGEGIYPGYHGFDPSGETLYYATTNREWTQSALWRRKAGESAKRLSLLQSSWEGEPFVSADGTRLYFTAILPPGDKPWHSDLYVAERKGDGWDTPHALPAPINTPFSEWHVSLTATGVLYFCSERNGGRLKGDIFRAVPEGRNFRVEKLPVAINTTSNDCDPLIAPDESWLVFHSDRPGGNGAHDLYISFRAKTGAWSTAVNMGSPINSPGWEMAPTLTPDGRYLMFTRRKDFVTDVPSQILWVSRRVIARYRHDVR